MTPTRPCILFPIFLLIFPLVAWGQLETGIKLADGGRYDEALQFLQRIDAKDAIDFTKAQYEIGRIYFASSSTMYNLDSAYAYLDGAQRERSRLKDGQKKKLDKEGYSSVTIRKALYAVGDSMLASLRRSPSLEKYTAFLNDYKRINYKTKAAAADDQLQLVADAVRNAQSFSDLTGLYEEFEKELKAKQPTAFKEMEDRMVLLFVAEKGWGSFQEDFVPNYRLNSNVKDPASIYFLRIAGSGNRQNFERLIGSYPNSLFARIGKDSLDVIAQKELLSRELVSAQIDSLPHIQDSGRLSALDNKLAPQMLNHLSISELDSLLQLSRYTDLPKLTNILMHYYIKSGSVAKMELFQQRFPAYAQNKELYQAISRIKKEDMLRKATEGLGEAELEIAEKAPSYAAFKALQNWIKPELEGQEWEKALAKTNKLRSFFIQDTTHISQLISALNRPTPDLEMLRLSDSINSDLREYCPVPSADGRYLFFCRNDGTTFGAYEKIYVSERINGTWSDAEPIENLNNVVQNSAPVGLSVDGTRLLIFKGGILSYTDQQKDGWSQHLAFPNIINVVDWQGMATLAANGRVLIFESRGRKDALGGLSNIDLYVAISDENGKWVQSFPIGPVLNTPENERAPFLHPDMRTLYFSSAGHGGFGGLDVFKTTRLDDTWRNWSPPEHLGKIINTTLNDWGYKLSTDGTTAFFASTEAKGGNSDIYQVTVPEAMRPELVSTLTLTVVDEANTPLEADVLLEELTRDTLIGRLRTNASEGIAFAVLPHEGRYGYVVTKEGYFPVSNHIDLRTKGNHLEVREVIVLRKLETVKEKPIVLKNLFFDHDEYSITSESYAELRRVARIIQENNFTVEIGGHTDNTGTPEYNVELSFKRAEAVKAFLVNQGIPSEKISTTGYGPTRPIAGNDTAGGRAQNRRVELTFSDMPK